MIDEMATEIKISLPMLAIADTSLTEAEIQAAVKVLRSGALRQGGECDAFEAEFAARVGAPYAVSSSSGTAALHLAYMTFLEPGDEVLVPSFTFIATGSVVCAAGGRPVFCDIDPETFLLDLADAERKLSPRTRAISPVHLFGSPCDVAAVHAFAAQHRLKIVWDAAQAHGARWQERELGGCADFVAYSFYPTKNLFVGEGGMTCTPRREWAERMRYLRSHGQTGRYLHTLPGLNYRMSDVEAAIGRAQLHRFDAMLAARRRHAAILRNGLSSLQGLHLQKIVPGGEPAWHQFCFRVEAGAFGCDRNQLAQKLANQGIATAVHYPRGLHQQPVFRQLYGDTSLPTTEALAESILAVPVHHGLAEDAAERIVAAMASARGA